MRDEIRFGSLVPDPPASNGTLPGTSTFVSAPHNLETGDAVYYWAPASGGTGVGGLISGKRYIVYVVDATTLKLLDPLTMATNPIESVSFNAGAVNGTSIDATNGFQNGDAVTYHAPPSRTFSSAAVELAVDGAGQPQRNSDNTPIYAGAGDDTIFLGSNPDSDGVFQTGHGYSTGDQITYKVDCPSGVATCKNVFGATVADGTTVTRFVIRIDNFRIKLAASKCHATGAGADCATTTVNGALQTLPRATFNVASTAAFAASGSFTVGGVIGTCSYGGKTATAFTDVTGCIGTPSNGATVTATNQPNQPLALDPDRTTDGTKVVHTIKRTNDAPLTGLVDGQVYFVVGTPTATSFQISASRNGTALNADNNLDGGLHTFAIEGVDLTSVGAGDQSLVLDLTTQGAGKQRLDGVGGGGTLAGAPSGDGIATASGSGSGGGVVDVKTATSTATVTPKLSNTIGGSAQLTALNIEIKTDNRGRVSAISSNGGGGLVTIGQADATATLNATTTISIASSAILTAANSLTVDASATVGANAKAGTQSAGLGAGVHANATATMNYTTTATIDGTLTAGGKLTLKSRTAITGNADASAQGGGLGVDSDATAVVNIGTGEADSTNAVTRTTIKAGARLSGDKVEIDAIIDSLYARSVAKSVADAFGADSDATATVNANGVAEVLLETKSAAAGYQIIGNQAVWLQALYDNVNVSTSSDAACNCFAGDATARSDVYYDTLAKVTGRNESFIETADLTVDANQNRDRYDKHANAHGGAFVGHHEPRDGDFNAYRRIYWETTTIMLGEPNPVLVVDQNGKITKLVNVTVKDELGNSYALDSIIPAGRRDPRRRHPVQLERLRALPREQADGRAGQRDLGQCRPLRLPGDLGLRPDPQLVRPQARHAPDRRGQRREQRDHQDRRQPRPGRRRQPGEQPVDQRERRIRLDVRVRHRAQLRADARRDPEPPAGQRRELRHRPRGPPDGRAVGRGSRRHDREPDRDDDRRQPPRQHRRQLERDAAVQAAADEHPDAERRHGERAPVDRLDRHAHDVGRRDHRARADPDRARPVRQRRRHAEADHDHGRGRRRRSARPPRRAARVDVGVDAVRGHDRVVPRRPRRRPRDPGHLRRDRRRRRWRRRWSARSRRRRASRRRGSSRPRR